MTVLLVILAVIVGWLMFAAVAGVVLGKAIHGPHGPSCGCACPADSSNDTTRSFR